MGNNLTETRLKTNEQINFRIGERATIFFVKAATLGVGEALEAVERHVLFHTWCQSDRILIPRKIYSKKKI
jgi:hypothetical protein